MASLDFGKVTIRPEGHCNTETDHCPFYKTFVVTCVKPRCTLFNIPIIDNGPLEVCNLYVRDNTTISLRASIEATP